MNMTTLILFGSFVLFLVLGLLFVKVGLNLLGIIDF